MIDVLSSILYGVGVLLAVFSISQELFSISYLTMCATGIGLLIISFVLKTKMSLSYMKNKVLGKDVKLGIGKNVMNEIILLYVLAYILIMSSMAYALGRDAAISDRLGNG